MASKCGEQQRQWQVGKSLIACNQYRLKNQIDCDVVFHVKTSNGIKKIGAHKYMLITRSPVFEAMLSGNFKEGHRIDITDVNHSVVMNMLMYIYTDDVVLTADNVLQLLFVAGKYILEGLSDMCAEFLDHNMDDSNVCTILTHSIIYSEDTLVAKCMEYIRKHAKDVFKSDDFLSLSHEALCKILKDDEINIDTECLVFDGCLKWSTNNLESNQEDVTDEGIRSCLGNCIFVIRFCSMTAEEFANHVASRNILTAEEKSAFFYYILTSKNTDIIKSLGFNVNKRSCSNRNLCTCYDHDDQNDQRQQEVYRLDRGGSFQCRQMPQQFYQLERSCDDGPNVCEWRELVQFKVTDPVSFSGVSIYISHGQENQENIVNEGLDFEEMPTRGQENRENIAINVELIDNEGIDPYDFEGMRIRAQTMHHRAQNMHHRAQYMYQRAQNKDRPRQVLWKSSVTKSASSDGYVSLRVKRAQISLIADKWYTIETTTGIHPNTQNRFQRKFMDIVHTTHTTFEFDNSGSSLFGRIHGVFYDPIFP